ncbi:hypothetical protein TEA_020129 [Camellia sinensis var. sinensis]|uniref:Two-component response regulator n=2 Tax=Camellia sinensis TaxID=4442 RepID=A0A4V3WKT9_CAMSN|nr:hypothetical protein TEA_020129 [Camellia sinensis var. sinensis]
MSVTKEKHSTCTTNLEFPAGLRVLAVDDDCTCLQILAKMLQTCRYEGFNVFFISVSIHICDALSILRQGKSKFDIVISDVHMPDMDGFKLLEIICLEMDLPVVMMSADDENDVVMKGIIDGACDYLVKPVRMEAIKYLWKHVVRKQKYGLKAIEQSKNEDNDEIMNQKQLNAESHITSMDTKNCGSSNCEKDEEEEGKDKDDSVSLKKPRMVWTPELHQQFVAAVNQIGLKNAVPKKILEVMNVSGLTRENVASHLQKYRLYLRRVDDNSPHECKFSKPLMHSQEINLQLASSNIEFQDQPHQLQSLPIPEVGQQRSNAIYNSDIPLPNQRNFYHYGMAESRFGMGQLSICSRDVNLSSEVPTIIESDQLTSLNKFARGSRNIGLQICDETSDKFNSLTIANSVHGNLASSSTIERPSKMQKLNQYASNEAFNNGAIRYSVSTSPTITKLYGQNSFDTSYVGNGTPVYISDSNYEFVEHFDQDDFNIRPYDEQFVGHAEDRFDFDSYPTDKNSMYEVVDMLPSIEIKKTEYGGRAYKVSAI